MVKQLLEKLGGTNLEDLGDKTAISEDHTLTWDTMLDATGNGQAELAYKTIASALSFENGDSLAADNFTSAAGANATVNTGSSDAVFDTDHYRVIGNTNIVPATSTASDSTVSVTTEYDVVTLVRGFFSQVYLGTSSGGQRTGNINILNAANDVLATKFFDETAVSNIPINFIESDYAGGTLPSGTYTIEMELIIAGAMRTKVTYSDTQTEFTIASQTVMASGSSNPPITFTAKDFTIGTNSVVCDTNTLAIDTSTNSFALHWQGDFPTNTSGSFDLISGATTVNLPVDSVTKKTGFVDKGALGDITIVTVKPKLTTTSTSVTPTIYGWGAKKI